MNKVTHKHALVFATLTFVVGWAAFVSVHAAPKPDEPVQGAGLIYNSQAAQHSIYGYSGPLGPLVSSHPEVIYVSQAYGQAIYSYPRVAADTHGGWSVEYVDGAYGQAIYSYPRVGEPEGSVQVQPLVE